MCSHLTESIPASAERLVELTDAYLGEQIKRAALPANLAGAVEYAVMGGGKRLRPVMTLMACEAVGGVAQNALPAAGALELIHTFSLVHDDLPAMDDDDLRRGRATVHVQFDEAMAILAGDAMMSLAFQWIAFAGLEPTIIGRVTGELAEATTRMIAGQVYDTLGGLEENLAAEHRLRIIHDNKTAALIRSACRMGALCGEAGSRDLECLSDYGQAIGLMFQIVDDLLDVTQTVEHVGKATGKDTEAGKLTFPSVLGIDASRAEVEKLRTAAHSALEPIGSAGRPMAELCDYLAVRTR